MGTAGDSVQPRHVLCLLGKWRDFSPVQSLLADSFPDFTFDEEFSQLTPDPRMPEAFEASVVPGELSLTDGDRTAIRDHSAVAYILSPRLEPQLAEAVSSRALHLVSSLLERGAVAAKSESAGLAHGRARWLQLAAEHAKFQLDGDQHSARMKLYYAWVQRPIVDEDALVQYSIGMHLLGLPDTEIDAELDFDSATEWLDLMGLYLAADRPTRPILAGEGLRFASEGPRRIIEKHPCSRYEEDAFFFNPYGYNRLVAPP